MDNMNQTTAAEVETTEATQPKKKKIGVAKKNYPTQDRINFAIIGVEQMKLTIMIPAIVLIVLAAGVFGKIFVADRFVKVSRLNGEVNELQTRIDTAKEEIASYGELEKEFAHYTYTDMTEDELRLQDREDVARLISKYVLNRALVGSWNVSENIVSLPITGVTFQEIGEIVADLEEDDMVEYCEVVAAATDDSGIVYSATEGESIQFTGNQDATAQVTIYLKDVVSEQDADATAETEVQ
ncbi:MAG: hypothetical protein K5853_05970 [Lachnospiraceae bacterium]|nr:hypothetical protein [Lachnospiraceae bacterium]